MPCSTSTCFGSDLSALFDPARGGLDLAAGVLGGLLTGTYVASLLGAPVGRWAHLLALPVLILLGAGKLTMVLGGSGQGLPFDGTWATAYFGPGPWARSRRHSPATRRRPTRGSRPCSSRLCCSSSLAAGGFRRRDGRAPPHRDRRLGARPDRRLHHVARPGAAGPLGAAGWFSLALAAACLVGHAVLTVRRRQGPGERAGAATDGAPAWPDAETRPGSEPRRAATTS